MAMAINRARAQEFIKRIPAEVRNAARAERKALNAMQKENPQQVSFPLSHGNIDFSKNELLSKFKKEVREQLAKETYSNSYTASRSPITMVPAYAEAPGAAMFFG